MARWPELLSAMQQGVAVIYRPGALALFGFLNRWNDTLATPLEAVPLQFARQNLGERDWTPGHRVRED